MKVRTIKNFFLDSLKNVTRNKLMSIASVGTVIATLFVFGIVLIIMSNINHFVNSAGNQIEIKAYLNKDISGAKKDEIKSEIENLSHVEKIEFETKEKALENMKNQLGEDSNLVDGLENKNPLPESFIIKVDKPENVKETSFSISKMEGIKSVNDGKETVARILRISGILQMASIGVMIILGIIAVFLISNTIKLTVYARKKEIEIMKYVGATDWYIRWPFVIEGVLLGVIGSVISLMLLAVVYKYVAGSISNILLMFRAIPFKEMVFPLLWKFVLFGIGIGGIGSLISLRRFLRV